MELLVAFAMFALLIVSWIVMPDRPAVAAKAVRPEPVVDPGIMPARA